jgi:hypothetical protein
VVGASLFHSVRFSVFVLLAAGVPFSISLVFWFLFRVPVLWIWWYCCCVLRFRVLCLCPSVFACVYFCVFLLLCSAFFLCGSVFGGDVVCGGAASFSVVVVGCGSSGCEMAWLWCLEVVTWCLEVLRW